MIVSADEGTAVAGQGGIGTQPVNPGAAGADGRFAQVKDPLSDDTFTSAVRQLVARARAHMDSVILPKIRKGWDYYQGRVDFTPANPIGSDPLSGEVQYEGSKVVMTECRDAVQSMLPDLLRVFLGTERAVEFVPQGEEDVAGAEQATDYINWVFRQQNDGESLLEDMAVDWMVKFLALKVYWFPEEKRESYPFSGLDEATLSMLVQQAQLPGSDIVSIDAQPRDEATLAQGQGGPAGQAPGQVVPEKVYDGELVRVQRVGRERVELVPHEEFLIDGDAYSADTALIIGQDCYRLVSDVVAMGVDYERIRPHIGKVRMDRTGIRQERTGASFITSGSAYGDEAIQYVRVVEAQVRLDRDGDGIAERYRIVGIGDAPIDIVFATPNDDVGWIVSSPYRMPHQPIGVGVVEATTDLQDLSTAVMRGILNSLNRSIVAREVVAGEGTKAYEDLTSWFKGPIRVDRQGDVQVFQLPFTGQFALPILDLIEQRKSMRTGIDPAGQGLDPDALKGQTVQGAHSIVSAPQSRMEFLVREFGISVLRPMFKQLLALSCRYQDKQKMIRLRNKWVPVDPRSWNSSMDAFPRVGLGTGTRAEQFIGLQMVAAKQEMLMATNSPLVNPMLQRNTYAAMAELAGLKDTSRFFAEVDEQALAQHQQQMAAAAQQAQAQQVQAVAAVEGVKAKVQADAKVQSSAQAAQIAAASAEQQAQIKAASDADLQTRVAELEASLARYKAGLDWSIKARELDMEMALERQKMANRERGGNANVPAANRPRTP